MNNIIIRTDISTSIGFGHVARIETLLNYINYVNLIFVLDSKSDVQLLDSFNFTCEILVVDEEHKWIESLDSNDIVLIDSYIFDRNLFSLIRLKFKKLIYIDDLCDGYYDVDLLINHSDYFKQNEFLIGENTKVKLGLKYALINPIFKSSLRKIESFKTVCFCQGGSDVNLFTEKILNDILEISDLNKIICISAENKLIQNPKLVYTGKLNKSQVNEIFRNSDIIISPTSTMVIEALASNALVIPYYFVDNQKKVYDSYKLKCAGPGLNNIKNFSKYSLSSSIRKIQLPLFIDNSYISSELNSFKKIIND